MKYFKILLASSAIITTLNFIGCDREENNPVDPCETLHAVTADFDIIEVRGFPMPDDYPMFDTDTVATDFVLFRAKEEGAQYEWTLGSETIMTKSFTRYSFPRGQNISVSLKVLKEPNTECFPNDDGEDVQSRQFYTTSNYDCDSNVNGVFVGNNDDDNGQREIEIDVCRTNPVDPAHIDLRINNLLDGCDAFGFAIKITGYSHIYFKDNADEGCFNPTGIAKLSDTNPDSITIEYRINDATNSGAFIEKTFKGIRK